MSRRERKRKSRTFLKDAIRNAEQELEVLLRKAGEKNCFSYQCRVRCLMNRTLPNLQSQLASLEKKESRLIWIQ